MKGCINIILFKQLNRVKKRGDMEAIQQDIDINQITLDINNPRIRRLVESFEAELTSGNEVDESQIILFLQHTAQSEVTTDKTESLMTYAKLQNSIIQNKGILNPIIVRKTSNDSYKCIEGNTRLAIYKIQNEKNPEEDCWQKIKCTIYEEISGKTS